MRQVVIILGLILLFLWEANTKKIAYGSANNWKLYENGAGLYIDVDTSKAGFKKTPMYFTSLSGKSNHYVLKGIEAIYHATKTGFRVYIRKIDQKLTIDYAKERKWTLHWIGIEKSSKDITISSARKWLKHKDDLLTYLKVKTNMKGYHIFTSLGGDTRHWDTTGASGIYLKKNGFNVFLRRSDVLYEAKTYNWHVNWMKVRAKNKKYVTGATNKWKLYENGAGLYVDVNTKKYGFKKTPRYFTTLSGTNELAPIIGTNAIYNPTKNGFRVYIYRVDGKKISVEMAKKNKWKLHWMAVGPRKTSKTGKTRKIRARKTRTRKTRKISKRKKCICYC